jgi:hypothetical protein
VFIGLMPEVSDVRPDAPDAQPDGAGAQPDAPPPTTAVDSAAPRPDPRVVLRT